MIKEVQVWIFYTQLHCSSLHQCNYRNYAYIIPGWYPWKSEITEVDITTPMISTCFWVPHRVAALLLSEHTKSATPHRCQSENALHDATKPPQPCTISEWFAFTKENAKHSLDGARNEQPTSWFQNADGSRWELGGKTLLVAIYQCQSSKQGRWLWPETKVSELGEEGRGFG